MTREMNLAKIDLAIANAGVFCDHMHQEGLDRGMIATFGNDFRVDQPFTGTESQIHNTLQRIHSNMQNEQTMLYDSIAKTIDVFWSIGNRLRPWLLIIITDGKDNLSTRYKRPEDIGKLILDDYNKASSNFIVLVGVGKDGKDIDKNALVKIGDYGDFAAITIDNFYLLEKAFWSIALRVTESVVGTSLNLGSGISWTELSQVRQLTRVAFDYAFLIDRSGSMTLPA